jgi:hypothetical protein
MEVGSRMADSKALLRFSDTFRPADRAAVMQVFIDEGIDARAEAGDIAYRGTGASPEHLVIDFIVGYGVLQFLQGYVSAASADAWAATKRAFKQMRARHRGKQEINILADDGTFLARYILPSDPSQWDAAIDAIDADLVALQRPDERWWLHSPVSRWGTVLEAANQQSGDD